jgi:Translation elongation factors (GTPases)
MGDVTGGLASKRARISGTDSMHGGELVVKAQVPLARSPTIRPN